MITRASARQSLQDAAERKNRGAWATLPYVPVLQIMSYLRETDRLNMSLVCKNWRHAFTDPCLWTKRDFRYGGGIPLWKETRRAIGFASQFGAYLKDLRLSCYYPIHIGQNFQDFIRELTDVLVARGCSLRRFAMTHLICNNLANKTRDLLCRSIAQLMREQTCLEVFDMSGSKGMSNKMATDILTSVSMATKTKQRLRVLNIRDIFPSGATVLTFRRYRAIWSSFHALQILRINFTYLDDELLQELAEASPLRRLCLTGSGDSGGHSLSTHAWRQVTKKRPGLRVEVWLRQWKGESRRWLSPRMPLAVLRLFSSDNYMDEYWGIPGSLLYIADTFNSSLEIFSCTDGGGPEVIDFEIIYLLDKCQKLREVDLGVNLALQTVDVICMKRMDNAISPVKLHIALDVSSQMNELDNIIAHYQAGFTQSGFIYEFDEMEMDIDEEDEVAD